MYSRQKRKPTKFRDGQFIVITDVSRLYGLISNPIIGFIYQQDSLDETLHCNGKRYPGYNRDNSINWRFARTDEVRLYLKSNKGPVRAPEIEKILDDYCIFNYYG